MLDFLLFTIVIIGCLVIVITLSKLSSKSIIEEKYHYRCDVNFRHFFTVKEIEALYDTSSTIACPVGSCNGELKLYRHLEEDEVVYYE